MGFNAVILVRNADLPLIEQDPEFGAKVASVIRGADVALHLAGDVGRQRTVTLSEVRALHKDPAPDYDIQSTTPAHADVDQIFLVENGSLLTVRRYGDPMEFAEWERFAVKAKELGIESKIGTFDSRKLPAVPFRTESEVMHGWEDEEFDSGVTAISVIIDALDQIRRDENFGRATAHQARAAWADERVITQLVDGSSARSGIMLDRDIRAKNHANAASVITTTLPGESDIVIVSGNWGRALRADTPIEHKVSGREASYAALRSRDIDTVADALLSAGFSVKKPSETRMRGPHSWQKSGFVTDFPKAEEDAGLSM